MSILEKIRPQFWDTDPSVGPAKSLFNYRRIWRFAMTMLTVVALVPLLVMAFIDYNVTRHSLEQENLLRTARTTSNTRRNRCLLPGGADQGPGLPGRAAGHQEPARR